MLSEAALADLRVRNPVADVAVRLGAVLKRRGRTLMGTCPMCGGGRSALRFEIKRDDAWACAVCADGGDVIRLVERAQGLSFLKAVEWLGGAQDIDPEEAARRERELAARRAKREADSARYREEERARLYRMWREAQDFWSTPVEAYLRGRDIFALDGVIVKFDPAARYYDGEIVDERGRKRPRLIFTGPAMLAPFVDGGGKFRGLHQTWIDPENPGEKATIADPETGEILPSKKMRGSKAGCFLLVDRVFWAALSANPHPASSGGHPLPGGEGILRLASGEGIETTLSVRQGDADRKFFYAAAGDLGNLAGPAVESVPHPTLKRANGRPERVPGPEPDLSRPGLPIPDSVEELLLIRDGDSEPFLTALAMERASRRYARPGRLIGATPTPEGVDLNDVLRGKGGERPGVAS
ncbi:CHC2-type zinc finger protein [Roseiarcus fermentans]|uniref:CHC2-type zinc finger protein n=1 Tax=Roseiarcus fermentans TaxID=1473586 RepID=A0A366EQR6_9HYPH|nr:CHC2 zinc finger domain-containing protein [Roseiarcus fermentans]RBP03825.1 CHC2-type zinc finger protein [Roseiarcus fermentans]